MATLWITAFGRIGKGDRGSVQAAELPALADLQVAIGAGSVQSAALPAGTTMIRTVCDAVCAIAVGSNPTATAVGTPLVAGLPEYFTVELGQAGTVKVAAITR